VYTSKWKKKETDNKQPQEREKRKEHHGRFGICYLEFTLWFVVGHKQHFET
jgi:hypothetical protein